MSAARGRAARAARAVARAVVLALAATVVLVLLDPGDLAARTPVAQLVALRGLVGVLLVTAAVLVLGAAALWRRAAERLEVRPPGRALPVALAAVLALGGAGQAAVLVGRGLDGSGPVAARDDELVVLSFNTFGVAPVADLVDLVEAQDADVVVLAETSARTARAVARSLTDAGRPTTALAADADGSRTDGVALLLREDLGAYAQRTAGLPATSLGTFAAVRSGDAASTGATTRPVPDVVVAVHTRAPSASSSMPEWRAHAAGVAEVCAGTPGAVVAGDLNATLDHPGLDDLGPCVDAATAAGAGGLGTWPSDVPRVLGAPIDHVLVDGRTWRVTSFAVLGPVGGSDHRPVVAHLARR